MDTKEIENHCTDETLAYIVIPCDGEVRVLSIEEGDVSIGVEVLEVAFHEDDEETSVHDLYEEELEGHGGGDGRVRATLLEVFESSEDRLRTDVHSNDNEGSSETKESDVDKAIGNLATPPLVTLTDRISELIVQHTGRRGE
jgi:hypothetical protein